VFILFYQHVYKGQVINKQKICKKLDYKTVYNYLLIVQNNV